MLVDSEQSSCQLPEVLLPLRATFQQPYQIIGETARANVTPGQRSRHRGQGIGIAA
jgi:hypothetical protein